MTRLRLPIMLPLDTACPSQSHHRLSSKPLATFLKPPPPVFKVTYRLLKATALSPKPPASPVLAYDRPYLSLLATPHPSLRLRPTTSPAYNLSSPATCPHRPPTCFHQLHRPLGLSPPTYLYRPHRPPSPPPPAAWLVFDDLRPVISSSFVFHPVTKQAQPPPFPLASLRQGDRPAASPLKA